MRLAAWYDTLVPLPAFHALKACRLAVMTSPTCSFHHQDKLNLWPYYHLTFKCDLDLQPTWTNVSNGTAILKENNCAKLFWNPCINVEVVARTSSIYEHFIIWTSSVALTFNLPEQFFQMALLLFKENNCAQLFWNPCINVDVMARTSSIYDHFMILPSNVTLTFNLPEIKALQALHDAQPLPLHQAKWPSLIFARRLTSSGHALYLYKVLCNYLEWYHSYRVDMISILKITKENNSAKRYDFHSNHIQNYKGA